MTDWRVRFCLQSDLGGWYSTPGKIGKDLGLYHTSAIIPVVQGTLESMSNSCVSLPFYCVICNLTKFRRMSHVGQWGRALFIDEWQSDEGSQVVGRLISEIFSHVVFRYVLRCWGLAITLSVRLGSWGWEALYVILLYFLRINRSVSEIAVHLEYTWSCLQGQRFCPLEFENTSRMTLHRLY